MKYNLMIQPIVFLENIIPMINKKKNYRRFKNIINFIQIYQDFFRNIMEKR